MNEIDAGIEAGRKLFAAPCAFVWGSTSENDLPAAKLPEIAFVGRSNAGKSSLINALAGRKALARVSHTPGRTRQINFFDLGGKLMLSDLPGYGYARASKTLADEWRGLIFAYLRGRTSLRRVILLIDARRGPMALDRAAMEALDASAVSFALALTKIDQLARDRRVAAQDALAEEARRHTAAYPRVFATSAREKLGLDELKAHLAALAAY
jgi:GTP-binding protein